MGRKNNAVVTDLHWCMGDLYWWILYRLAGWAAHKLYLYARLFGPVGLSRLVRGGEWEKRLCKRNDICHSNYLRSLV